MIENLNIKELKGLNKATEHIHVAAQFLAMAGVNFVKAEKDTSHMNLGWLSMKEKFITHPFGPKKDYVMELSPAEMTITLYRISKRVEEQLKLKGVTQKVALKWIKEKLAKHEISGAGNFKISPPYELPDYADFSEKKFKKSPRKAFETFAKIRTIADHFIKKYSLQFEGADECRTWPHHFDHASLVTFSKLKSGEATKTMGLGLAIHDSMIHESYFYISAWNKNKELNMTKMPALTAGEWLNDGFKGSVLRISTVAESKDQEQVVDQYFKESISAIEKLLKVTDGRKK